MAKLHFKGTQSGINIQTTRVRDNGESVVSFCFRVGDDGMKRGWLTLLSDTLVYRPWLNYQSHDWENLSCDIGGNLRSQNFDVCSYLMRSV